VTFSGPRNKIIRSVLGWTSVFVCFFITKTTTKGKENIPKKGPYILAPNHFSLLDPFVLHSKHNKLTTYLMAEDLDDLGWKELWIPWLYGVLLVNRKTLRPSTIKATQKQIKKKEPICIFPEGTSVGRGLKPLKDGASYFAVKNKIPIIPVALSGTETIAKKLKKLQRAKIKIQFGAPILAKEGEGVSTTTENINRALRKMLPKKYL
jgi:1-acyl-sn-glycerol-3-phosphate acyltransferase|tara:strand:- start:279 stop:899 length:621 start_codon:yes stop_codon:yes gene_type:complete